MCAIRSLWFALFVGALTAEAVHAAALYGAAYDPRTDTIVVEIAYRGTRDDHDFILEWDACEERADGPGATAARIIDLQGDDIAQTDFRVLAHLSLAGIPCRPAYVTLRLGPVDNRTVLVPEAAP